MTSDNAQLQHDVLIVNELGLHARTAAALARAAAKAQGAVWLQKDRERVDAKQIIDILMLAAARGETLTIGVEKQGDAAILDDIVTLFKNGFGE